MAALWGSTLVVMKGVYAHMSPENLLACRFALAAAAFGILFPKAWRTDMRTITKGAILGVLFAAGQLLQSIGLSSTEAATNGFIASLYVVFTPLLAAVIFRRKAPNAVWGAVALATVGMGVLALDPSSIGSGFGGVGQLLTLASALAYAGHIVATGRFANPSNVASLGLYQTITVAVVCTIPVA